MLLSHFGMRSGQDMENRRIMAEAFLRPQTWKYFCDEISSDNCTTQQINSVVGILLPFIEGYCITRSNLRVSTEELSDHLATLLYKLLD